MEKLKYIYLLLTKHVFHGQSTITSCGDNGTQENMGQLLLPKTIAKEIGIYNCVYRMPLRVKLNGKEYEKMKVGGFLIHFSVYRKYVN